MYVGPCWTWAYPGYKHSSSNILASLHNRCAIIIASSRQISFIHCGRDGESVSPVSILSSFFFMCHTIHIILFWAKILLSGGLIFPLKWRDIFPWSQWKCNKTSVSDFKNRPDQTRLFTDNQRRSMHQKGVSVFRWAKTHLHQCP